MTVESAGDQDAEFSWRSLTTYGVLQRAAALWPDASALVSPRERLTYAQLLERAGALARGLHAAGIGPNDRVATLIGTRSEWVLLHYAVARLGAVLVPLNLRLQSDELRYALARVDATVLVCADREGAEELLPRLTLCIPGLRDAAAGAINCPALPALRWVICHATAGPAPCYLGDLTSLLQYPAGGLTAAAELPAFHGDPERTALIIFTSGSTGRPKAAMLSGRNLVGHAHYLSRLLTVGPGDRYLNVLPFFHIAGYAQGLLMNHYAGSALYLLDSFDPDALIDVIASERITAWAGMPVTIRRVLDRAGQIGADLGSLEKQHGVSAELWDRVTHQTGARLMTRMYGLTESAGLITMTPLSETDPERRRESVGVPLPGVEVCVVNPDSGCEQPTGQPGEILFRGWNLFGGYYGDPAATACVMDAEGYCRTGDRGFVDERGRLHLAGRFKEMIKTGGENVSQAEVESFLKENLPGVAALAVIGVPDQTWGEAVTAVLELDKGCTLTLQDVQDRCRGHIASFKIPRHVLQIGPGDWPLTAGGKVDRLLLRALAMERLGFAETHA